jgi:chromosome segregation ATPase
MEMNPLVLSFLCALAALGLIAYSVLDKENPLFSSGQRIDKSVSRPVLPAVSDMAAEKLEQQIIALEAETQKLVLEHRSLQAQLELAKKIETELKGELDSFKQINAERMKAPQPVGEDTQALKEKLFNKERELEKELSTRSELKNQLEEKINKLVLQEKKSAELTDKISALEAQVNEYRTALKSQADALEELKTRQPQPSAAQETDTLRKESEELKAAIAAYKEKEDARNKDLEVLKARLEEKETLLKKLSDTPAQAGISAQEYNRLKEKLEQAEEVLRILHAADK